MRARRLNYREADLGRDTSPTFDQLCCGEWSGRVDFDVRAEIDRLKREEDDAYWQLKVAEAPDEITGYYTEKEIIAAKQRLALVHQQIDYYELLDDAERPRTYADPPARPGVMMSPRPRVRTRGRERRARRVRTTRSSSSGDDGSGPGDSDGESDPLAAAVAR